MTGYNWSSHSYNIFGKFCDQLQLQLCPNKEKNRTEPDFKALGVMIPIMDVEVRHCAAVIAAAFLNPSKRNQIEIGNILIAFAPSLG
jgi:hypothetical protein